MNYKLHSTSDVQSSSIGEGTEIWQFSIILKGAVIGIKCNINCYVFIENDVIIGDYVTIKPGVHLWDGTRIGNSVFIGPNATFINDKVPRSKKYLDSPGVVTIHDGASIGANATVFPGIIIGRYSMIGAGSVITKTVPPFTVWYGNPATHKGFITREGLILDMDLTDSSGRIFVLHENEPILK